jgi:hypothetical protein
MKLEWQRVVCAVKPITRRLFFLISIALVAISCSKGSKDKPVLLGETDLAKITGTASLVFDKFVKVEIYNGTDWTLTDVDVILRHPNDNMKKLPNETGTDFQIRSLKGDTRRFRLELSDGKSDLHNKPTLKPFTTGEFSGDLGGFMETVSTNTAWSWELISALGFKN